MKILFWNTNKNKWINNTLIDIICENNISFVCLAEYEDDITQLISDLNLKGIIMQQYPSIGCDRITILGTHMDITPGRQTKYASFQIHNNRDIYCCIHLPSQIYSASLGMRNVAINTIISDVESTEQELSSENTVIVGDFNINPYDYGCLDALAFHGIPIFDIVKRRTRTIADKEIKMFYNPMWKFFGDDKKPYGTYYYSGNNTSNIFWQIYDQVIIRPSLKSRFVSESLNIISETENKYLLNQQGHPDREISDHLPITFEIQEE